jgi:hypothetical protein
MTEIQERPFTVATGRESFVPVSDVLGQLPPGKFSPRYVREAMSRLGFARKLGREYFTTPGEVQKFLEHIKENGLCRKTERHGQPSSRTGVARRVGTRGAMSPSVLAVVSPERELKEALARIASRKRSARGTATT